MSEKMRRIWLDEAIQNIEDLYNYYSVATSSKFADEIVKTIIDSSAILETFPKLAPVEVYLEDCDREFRSLVVMKGRFKVIYYIEGNYVIISFVRDCRQDIRILKNKLSN